MKTKRLNTLTILSLHLLLVACSKTETNDMMFKEAVSEVSSATPSPGGNEDPMQDPSVIIVNDEPKVPEVVVVPVPPVMEKPPVVVVEEKPPVMEKPPVVVVEEKPPVVVVEEKPPVVVVEEKPPVMEKPPVVVVEEKPPVVVVEEKPPVVVVTKPEVIYPESDIPSCKLNVNFNGAGSASRVAIASASKDELMKTLQEGFETLSSAEIAAMRKAIETKSSGSGVQYLKSGADFNKNALAKGAKVLIVTDGKGSSLNINGIGKNAQVYVMNVVDKHSTVCLQANGITDSSELFMVVKGDPQYVSRGLANVNGSGSNNIYMKVIGGNQTKCAYDGNGMKDATLMMITEGRNDTFNEINANGIADSKITMKIKGRNATGLGIKANGVKGNLIHLEMEGEDDVKAMLDVNGMTGNDVSGWLKAKSGGKVDPMIEDSIELMPVS